MNLPHYFLADLPAEAEITPAMVTEACHTLKRNRAQYLAARSTHSLVKRLSELAKEWLDPCFSFRKLALEFGPGATGFSQPTIARGLDAFFQELTAQRFQSLLTQDLGDGRRLDDFVSTASQEPDNRAAIAVGPELIAHFAAGNVPNPTLSAIVLGVLTRSAQFVKCARGSSLLPLLFAHSLHEVDPKLASCLELAEWKSQPADAETRGTRPRWHGEFSHALVHEADCITATGSDESLAAIRQLVPIEKRLLTYGQRLSFAFVASGMLAGLNAKKVVGRAAADVVAWDQLGCLSPHVVYVEYGGTVSAEQFAALLAEELASLEQSQPRGAVPVEIAAAISSRRSVYELRAAHSEKEPDAHGTRLWRSENSTAWTVVYESEPRFQTSCLHRFVYVKGVADLKEALQSADSVRGKVSTVGVAAPEDKIQNLAAELGRWGATRVCPLGKMQNPPLTWRHDGRPALGDLVRWTDWEIV